MEKKWIRSFFALGIGTACSKLAVFLLMPLYSAALTPADFGTVDIVINTAVFLLPLCSANAPETVFRFIAGGEREGAVLAIGKRLLWRGGAALLLILPLSALLPSVRPFAAHLLFYVIAAVLHSYYAHILRARGQYGFFAVQQIFGTLVTVLLAVLLLTVLGFGVGGYLAAIYLSDGLTAAILYLYLRPESDEKTDPSLYRSMLRYGIPLIPTALLWWVLSALDRYALLWFHGADSVGLYAAACKLPALMTLASSIFLEGWQYMSLRLEEGERRRWFDRAYGLLLLFLVGFAMLIALCCRPLLNVLLASDFENAVRYVPFLAMAMLFSALSSFLGSVYSLQLRTDATLSTVALGAGVHAVFSLILIPKWEIGGAIAATALAYGAVFVRRAVSCRRILPFSLRIGPLAASLAGLLLMAAAINGGDIWIAYCCIPAVLLPFWKELRLAWRIPALILQKNLLFSTKSKKHS